MSEANDAGGARVWVLTSGRTGDDKQSLRLANALGVSFEEKKIVFGPSAAPWRLMLGPGLSTIERERSSALEPPWPELVISTGWRQVPIVRWIREQTGGRTRLVQMNRPPGPRHFDLVLSPPQFEVPTRPNIMRLDWPLQLPPEPATLAAAAARFRDRLAPFPHPWTVLLVGGASHPFDLDHETAAKLITAASERARAAGGSLLVSPSRRTPKAAIEGFRAGAGAIGAPPPTWLWEWQPEASGNPYAAFLAGGDEFVVTPDSLSMLVEVARLGRPLAIAPHRRAHSLAKDARTAAKRLLHGRPGHPRGPVGEAISDLASFLGLKFGRDLARVSQRLVEEGWAAHFPDFGGHPGRTLPDDDFDRAVERTRALLGDD